MWKENRPLSRATQPHVDEADLVDSVDDVDLVDLVDEMENGLDGRNGFRKFFLLTNANFRVIIFVK